MHSWYFPKYSHAPVVTRVDRGHRPPSRLGRRCRVDRQPECRQPQNPDCFAIGAHGYQKCAPPKANTVDGTSIKVDYTSKVVTNHTLDSTTTAGEKQPLIMWDQMTQAARMALENTNFGDANAPMKGGNFMGKLAKAYYK